MGGVVPARLIASWSFFVASGGTMSAPRTSPERTLSIASARVATVTGSTDLKSSLGELRDVQALAADREARLPRGHLVDDRDLGLVRAARQREADEDAR